MNKTTECSVFSIALTRLKNICLLPFCTCVLCMMQFNGDIVLMHGEVLAGGAGRCCKRSPLFQLHPHPMHVPKLTGE